MSVVRLVRAVRPVDVAVVLAASALVATVVAPALHARALSAPTNVEPPSLVVVPGLGSRAAITPGSWSGSPTTFSFEYLRCPDGGGAAEGSDCTPIGAPTPNAAPHLVGTADAGHSLRARVTATNATGSTTSVSAASATVVGTDVNVTGCPSVQQGGMGIDELKPPGRLEIDRHTSSPSVITRSTQRIILRIEVVACDDQYVTGALVYATPTPYQQFSGAERATDRSGWATITLTRQRFFPATPRQQHLVVFVRARNPSENLLGGVSTRRLISLPVRLH